VQPKRRTRITTASRRMASKGARSGPQRRETKNLRNQTDAVRTCDPGATGSVTLSQSRLDHRHQRARLRRGFFYRREQPGRAISALLMGCRSCEHGSCQCLRTRQGELDPQRAKINGCAVHGVLRRDSWRPDDTSAPVATVPDPHVRCRRLDMRNSSAAHARRRVEGRLSLASSRCGFRLDLAVASRTYSKRSTGVASLDPERGNVNDCAMDGVLRRDNSVLGA
jgi:hypothetical protein